MDKAKLGRLGYAWRFLMLPSRKMGLRRDNLHCAPLVFKILGFALVNLGLLRGPKTIAVREIAILFKQVGDNLAFKATRPRQS